MPKRSDDFSDTGGNCVLPLLELRGITKQFGAVEVLRGVDLQVNRGEVLALVGDNGAGKSTLIRTISGAGPADAGAISWQGNQVAIDSPHAATSLGIATVYQDLALCDNLSVAANLFLGREEGNQTGRPIGWLDDRRMQAQAARLLQSLNVTISDVRRPVATLSGGQRQTVAIARALLGEPQLVILDEPTAALGVSQTEQVLSLTRRLREKDHAVVIISHNMDDVLSVADRITVLRLGRNNGEFSPDLHTRDQIVAAITGSADQTHHPHHPTAVSS
jgi:D-xylose transport system ATP-binding protein